MTEVTVGLDIGTTSVKAIAADADGNVVARSRVPHTLHVTSPSRMEHDPEEAWRRGPLAALAALGDVGMRAVSVAAMVPSLTAVDETGVAVGPGLLYGDDRGRTADPNAATMTGEFVGFAAWLAAEYPQATGLWPAPAYANHALTGTAVLDTTTAATAHPLYSWTTGQWDEALAAAHGFSTTLLPRLVPTGWDAGRLLGSDDIVVASGGVDAMAEQMVAGADHDGDVLVILGTTLIVWVVSDTHVAPAGYHAIPHSVPDRFFIGGPSNAGGLFCNWANALLAEGDGDVDPHGVPVWAPYPRGERTPFDDPDRRASMNGLDLTHGPAAARRAVWEASGFAVRRMIEASGVAARRIVATGGGIRVDPWVQAIADCTGLPVDRVAVPEGAALGSAFLARHAAGLEASPNDAGRWARIAGRTEPDDRWTGPTTDRFASFQAL